MFYHVLSCCIWEVFPRAQYPCIAQHPSWKVRTRWSESRESLLWHQSGITRLIHFRVLGEGLDRADTQ